MPVLKYCEFDGEDGFRDNGDGTVSLHAHGDELLTVAVAGDVRRKILSYEILNSFPGWEFTLTKPMSVVVDITPFPVSLDGEISGFVVLEGVDYPWDARHTRHRDFLRWDEVPAESRPRVVGGNGGWEFTLPAVLQSHPDHALVRRIAVALHDYVEDVAGGRQLPVPYRRTVTNIMDDAHPMWAVNLPRLVPVGERRDSGII